VAVKLGPAISLGAQLGRTRLARMIKTRMKEEVLDFFMESSPSGRRWGSISYEIIVSAGGYTDVVAGNCILADRCY
jgi:hypothetical protein